MLALSMLNEYEQEGGVGGLTEREQRSCRRFSWGPCQAQHKTAGVPGQRFFSRGGLGRPADRYRLVLDTRDLVHDDQGGDAGNGDSKAKLRGERHFFGRWGMSTARIPKWPVAKSKFLCGKHEKESRTL